MYFQKQVHQLAFWLRRLSRATPEQGCPAQPRRLLAREFRRQLARQHGKRSPVVELMEPRHLMAADVIQIGAVYVEEDLGSDLHGDLFYITFQGGAPNTQLTQLTIDGDLNQDGFGLGDLFFDTAESGLGADHAYDFRIEELITVNPNASVTASVQDGTSQLTLNFTNFVAGDRLVFSIDVDEVQFYDPNETDVDRLNENFDPITSGVEFQNSFLAASFTAPHYEIVDGQDRFLNRYDNWLDQTGLPLPRDNADGKRDRSAGAGFELQQVPKPISLSGTVFVDSNEDLSIQSGEQRLAGVNLELFRLENGVYVSTGHRTVTNSQGVYGFGTELGLQPGTYQVRESQPSAYYSVGATTGLLSGGPVGALVAGNPDVITEIDVPLGDLHATELNFAENLPASISGHVCVVLSGFDCFSTTSEKAPMSGVQIELRSANGQILATQLTDANGYYEFTGLRAGSYSLTEVTPADVLDGESKVGSAGGNAVDANRITQIVLAGGTVAIDYDFCELTPSELSGHTYFDANNNGVRNAGESPLVGVRVTLWDEAGSKVAETRTDNSGFYHFTGLRPGTYRVTEQTPADYIPGQAAAGTVGGVSVGQNDSTGDVISAILLPAGASGINYDFGEILPGSISGRVIADVNGNCVIDATGEMPLAGVTIELLDANGSVLQTMLTDANGQYTFDNLLPGTYAVREIQPDGYFHGGQNAGSGGGDDSQSDLIRAIQVSPDVRLVDYDFCDLPPGSLAGAVFADTDQDCVFDAGERPIAGVAIELLDASGAVIRRTTTGTDGLYRFDDLAPGSYSVREIQPAGYFHGGQRAGSGGGDHSTQDLIRGIQLGAGVDLVDYDFCEIPPSSISGVVFSDLDEDCDFDSGEQALAGVTIELLDASGTVLRTTRTDANGRYIFDNLAPGEYSVRELQPAGYFHGGQRAGSGGGDASSQDLISSIQIGAGVQLVDYNFCELEPASLAGSVFVDLDADCIYDAGEQPIAGVTITLLDDAGNVVGTTLTDSQGNYQFNSLRPGVYAVRETQPAGYFQGGQKAGSGGGDSSVDDLISSISLAAGVGLVDYDFCELGPGSISGLVFVDLDFDCVQDASERPLANVQVELLDSNGSVLATTMTSSEGRYSFAGLRPDTYSVREVQPAGYFHGGQKAPASGGDASLPDLIRGITLASGQVITGANFCEVPPAEITGFVFQDGPVILSQDGEVPEDRRSIRDGKRTGDDTPIQNVTLELRTLTGAALESSRALPGIYDGTLITVQTDANGFFAFRGLRAGSYHVYQQQPDGFVDSLDTPGTTTGFAVNPGDIVPSSIINLIQLSTPGANPGTDAILAIAVNPGQVSAENNFSEVIAKPTDPAVPPLPPRPPLPPQPQFQAPPTYPGRTSVPVVYAPWQPLPLLIGVGHQAPQTWHLSIINGGFPRGIRGGDPLDELIVERNADRLDVTAWTVRGLQDSTWRIVSTNPEFDRVSQRMVFDLPDAVPLAGDFNGDGFDELALFLDGEWFIDLNANGRWDDADIWLKLGSEGDQPVVGDWDKDGKDDVGVFGRKWQGDNKALASESGLPDSENISRMRPKNVPPMRSEATDVPRLLQHSRRGPARADVIDHVFEFGGGQDVAVSGDFNGDGVATVGLYRNGRWTLDVDGDGLITADRDKQHFFGEAGDLPLVGDFDNDGVDELAIVRGRQVIVDSNSNGHIDATDRVFLLETEEGTVIVGDFDGDGYDEPAIHQSPVKRPRMATLRAS